MSTPEKTRIYDEAVNIDPGLVRKFWDIRLANNNQLNAVLLGNQTDSTLSNLRNEREKNLLDDFYLKDIKQKISVLDFGCGIGRWADNLKDIVSVYHGIDFSSECIRHNVDTFKNYKNLMFFEMSITDIKKDRLLDNYDLIIINGVLMYINDDELTKVFESLSLFNPKKIYIQESISILDKRLTLKKFYSEELNSDYNAIYRIRSDYDFFIKNYLNSYNIEKEGILLDKKLGARDETNAFYWFLNNKLTY